jgi:transcriptional regulator GlxA family with amidase domain
MYRHHTQQAVQALQSYAGVSRTPAFLQQAAQADAGDAAKMRLPLRYRRAYQYMMEHLADENLSVRQVAAHVGVTERALQLAFRAHLGVTPAELIRTRRVENIHQELQRQAGDAGVLEVASRWGVKNRSTLVHNYRTRFDETPTQTLRGAAEAGGMLPA